MQGLHVESVEENASLAADPLRGHGGEPPADGSAAMFDAIAGRYDLLNRWLSFGADRRWRRQTVASLGLSRGCRVLDLATGTADLAIQVARAEPTAVVEGLDPSEGMLAVARSKIARAALDARVRLRLGDAQSLPFADDSFDACGIAFGIRNVKDRRAALREMARVTRASGRVAILELTEPVSGVLAPLARWHIHEVVPRVGALLSGHRQYRYLQRSIAAFPPAEGFAAMMEECGFEVLEARSLTLGVCHLFVARPVGDRP